MSSWRYKILSKQKVLSYIEKFKDSLLIEVYDGSPHLMIRRTKGFETIGRINKGVFKKLDIVLADLQPEYINVSHWKFKEDKDHDNNETAITSTAP